MATDTLVPYNAGYAESAVQSLESGEANTLIPYFGNGHGAVVVKAVLADGRRTTVTRLGTRPSENKLWQVQGPIDYVVEVKNAGCDVAS